MPPEDIIAAQEEFLHRGGLYVQALRAKWKSGELKQGYEFHEYPKMLTFIDGEEEVERSTDTVDRKTRTWKEKRKIIRQVVVHSAQEEDEVSRGGKTTVEQEAERQELIQRAKNLRIRVDPDWSVLRLKRELGDKLDAPEPVDEMASLRIQLQQLEEMAAMKAKIAELQAALAKPADDIDALRQELADLGITPDKRWGVERLRSELERATAPEAEAA